MPGWSQTLADYLPFESTFGFPITALVGPISDRELVIGLIRQFWWFWRVGTRRYSGASA